MYLYIDMFCCLRVERHETVDQCYRNDRTSCPGRCFEAAAFEVLYLIALSGSCSLREDQKVSSVLHVIADIYDHLQ